MIKFGQKITATTITFFNTTQLTSNEIFIDMMNNIYILGT